MRHSPEPLPTCGPRFFRRVFLAFTLVLACVTLAVAGGELRTWTDSTGKFKIKAKFIAEEKGKVTLEGENGKQFEIDVTKLSKADQKLVADLAKKAPAEDDPFKPAPATPAKPGKAGPVAKTITADWAAARTVDLVTIGMEWKAAVKAPDPPALTPKGVVLPPKTDFFESAKGLALSAASRRVAVGYLGRTGGRNKGGGRLVLADLAKGAVVGQAELPTSIVPIALHDDGEQVLLRREDFGPGNLDRLELWSVTAAGGQKAVEFTPYGDDNGAQRDVKWAAFLDGNRLATSSGGGKLAVWDLAAGKPTYHLKIQDACVPALSPDRKLIAFCTGKEVGLLDVDAGKVVGMQATPGNLNFPLMAFSPSGKRFGCVAFGRVLTWDTATGQLQRDMPLEGFHVLGVSWPGEDYLMVSNATIKHHLLLDLANQIRFWQYQEAEAFATAGGMGVFVTHAGGPKGPGALAVVPVPHPAAEQALKKALADPNFFVLRPGTKVRIDVSGLADPAERQKAVAALVARLRENKNDAGPDGTVDLVATTEVGKEPREISYRSFGLGGSRTYKVQEYVSRVQIKANGKVVWQASANNIPHLISLRGGETVEEYLRRNERPNYGYFQSVAMPKLLTRTPNAVGTSKVTPAGFQ